MKKELAVQTINQLPNEDISINDIIEALYIGMKIEKGLKDIESDNTVTHKKLKKEINQWKIQ